MRKDPSAIEAMESADGCKRWRLMRGSHGLYSYEEETLSEEIYDLDESGNAGQVIAESYWEPTFVSGLYSSACAARADALSTLPWLKGITVDPEHNDS